MPSQETNKVRPADLGIARKLPPELINSDIFKLLATVDENSPIGQKWKTAGGEGTFGKPLSNAQQTPDGGATYQQFNKGVIFYSPAYGAKIISTAIYSKWLALKGSANAGGNSVQGYIGYPIGNSFSIPNGKEAAYFERGMIIVRSDGQAFVVYGMIYLHYRELGDVRGFLGLPLSDEEVAPNGGRR